MGIELANAFIRVRGDSSGLDSDLDSLQKKTESKMKSIAAGAAGILAPFAAFGKSIIEQGLASAGAFEQTQVEMETMIGSVKETQDLLAKLTRFAVVTPFEMPQLIQVTRGLVQFGERGDQLMDTLKMLGDASGGTAQKFQDLGRIFNHVRGTGHLMQFQFRELSMRGIIALTDISKYYGVTTEEADKMISHGKVSFEEFRKILKGLTMEGGRYNNMMEKQSQTYLGLISTMNDALNITKRMLVTPLMPMFKAATNVIISFADILSKVATNGGTFVSFAFAGATAFAILAGSIAAATFAAQFFGITLYGTIIGTGVGAVVIALGAAFGALAAYLMQNVEFMDLMSETWQNIKDAFQEYLDAFNTFLDDNKETFDEIKALWNEIMTNLVATAKSVFKSISEYIFGMVPSVQTVVGWLKFVVDKVAAILDIISLLTTDWSLTWELMKTEVAIVLVEIADRALVLWDTLKAGAAGMLEASFVVWDTYFSNAAAGFIMLKDIVMNSFKTIVEIIKNDVETLIGILSRSFNTAKILLDPTVGINDKLKAIKDTASANFGAIVDLGKKNFGLLADNTKNNIDLIKGRFIGAGTDLLNLPGKMGAAFNKGFVKNLGEDSPLKGTIATLKDDAEKIKRKMLEARARMRFKRGEGGPEAPPPIAEAPPPGTPGGPGTPADFLKAGRYTFTDIGTKLQDALLKDEKGDLMKRQVDLAEMGLQKQDDILKATRDNKPKGVLS